MSDELENIQKNIKDLMNKLNDLKKLNNSTSDKSSNNKLLTEEERQKLLNDLSQKTNELNNFFKESESVIIPLIDEQIDKLNNMDELKDLELKIKKSKSD
jgi:hypothetical protein